MSVTVESVFAEVMSLPDEGKDKLLDMLLADIASRLDPDEERAHAMEAKRRWDEIRSGAVQALPGPETLKRLMGSVR